MRSDEKGKPAEARMTYPVTLDFVEPVPEMLDMGAMIQLVVAVACEADVDPAQLAFKIMDGDQLHAEGLFGMIEIPDPNPDAHDPRDGTPDLRPRARLRV